MSDRERKIRLLTKDNYQIWKLRIENILEREGLWELMTRPEAFERLKQENPGDARRAEVKAMGIMLDTPQLQ